MDFASLFDHCVRSLLAARTKLKIHSSHRPQRRDRLSRASHAAAFPAPLIQAAPLPRLIAVEPLPSDVTPFLLFPLPLSPNPIAVAPFLSDIAPCLLSLVPLLPHPMPVEQLHCNSGLTASVASFPPSLPPSHQSINRSPPTPSLGTSFCNVHSQRPLLLAHAVRAQVRSIQTCGKTVSPLR